MKSLLFLSILSGFLAGCGSPGPMRAGAFPRVKSELMLIVPEEAAFSPASPVSTSSADSGSVLIAPDVVAYPIAGREDSHHRDTMYGGTWAYRRTSPKWRLQPAPIQDVAVGPIRHDERSQIQPVQNQELDTFLLEQRAQNDQNRQAITRIIHLQQEFQKQLVELRRGPGSELRESGRTEDEAPERVDGLLPPPSANKPPSASALGEPTPP